MKNDSLNNFALLKVKCPVIAKGVGCEIGDMVLVGR